MKDRFENWSRPDIKDGELTKWHWKVIGVDGFELGDKTDIGAFTLINAKYGVDIEDEVQIGAHFAIYSESTIDNKRGKVTQKKNCKIRAHSVIFSGSKSGRKCCGGSNVSN